MSRNEPVLARLGVNIDHVATVRQARGTTYPDPVAAASVAEMAGADQITVHIRLDRRHIQERDIDLLAQTVQTRLNVEMAPEPEMLEIAERTRPHTVTLVPEREGEVTTEGGLDLCDASVRSQVQAAVPRLREAGIGVSVFIDPDPAQVQAAVDLTVDVVEFNTAAYAEAHQDAERQAEIDRLDTACESASKHGLFIAAGHGLHYHNVTALADLGWIEEFNIGHAIVGRALFSGMDAAVRDMKDLIA
jgi:pyridoxine 5-phosphate synthase